MFLTSSCKQSATLSSAEKAKIVQDVRTMLTAYCDDIKKDGLTAEFKNLDSATDFLWLPPGYTSPLSYDSVAAIIKKNAAIFSMVNNSFDTLVIIPLTKEFASYSARLRSEMTDTAGNKEIYLLAETGTVIKRNGQWKLLNGQTNLLQQLSSLQKGVN